LGQDLADQLFVKQCPFSVSGVLDGESVEYGWQGLVVLILVPLVLYGFGAETHLRGYFPQ